MEQLLDQAVERRRAGAPRSPSARRPDDPFEGNATATHMREAAWVRGNAAHGWRPRRAASSAPAVVIGAGPTGLRAAYHLGAGAVLVEKEGRVGGWCRSVQENGFTFDFAGHIMFSNDPYVHELYRLLLGDNVHRQDREAWVYSKGVYTRYPFQGALYGLPPEVIK